MEQGENRPKQLWILLLYTVFLSSKERQSNPNPSQPFIIYHTPYIHTHENICERLPSFPHSLLLSVFLYTLFSSFMCVCELQREGIYVEAEGYLKEVEVRARLDKKRDEVSIRTLFEHWRLLLSRKPGTRKRAKHYT